MLLYICLELNGTRLMYIWVVLATFIVALAAFNLPVRPDMRNVYVSPQAEAVITKLYLQHKAAKAAVLDSVETNGVYMNGEVEVSSIRNFLPLGFELSDDYESLDVTERNHSYLYCLDKSSPDLSVESPQCNGDFVPYLISYGCVPTKWRNVHNGKPNNDLIAAMYNVLGHGGQFGYSQEIEPVQSDKNILGSSMGINIRDKMWLSIPQFIISQDKGGNSFYNVCGDGGECDYCLVYMTILGAVQ